MATRRTRFERETPAAQKANSRQQGKKKGITEEAESLCEEFRKFDANGDGSIDAAELARVFKAIDPHHWTDDKISALMSQADTNGDGVIRYEEFVAWILNVGKDEGDTVEAIKLESQKSFDKAALIADCRATAGQHEQFTVTFEQDKKTKVGVKIDSSDGRILIIKDIMPRGLIGKYNDDNPHRQIYPGDCIVQVNGVEGTSRGLLEEFHATPMKGIRMLTITLQPRESAYKYVNKLTDTYEVETNRVDSEIDSTLRWAVQRNTGLAVAVKSVHKRSSAKAIVECEIQAMKQLDHPNVVKLYEVFEDFHDIHLVTERCKGGELFGLIVEEGAAFAERHASVVMHQLFAGLSHLRTRCVCHRDLRPENVLLHERTDIEQVIPKITGFGSAKIYDPDNCTFYSQVGDAMFRSPQVVSGVYDEKCDVWSMGVLMYLLLCGYPPFAGETEFETISRIAIGNVVFNDDWKDVSKEAIDLVTKMLAKDASERITAEDALHHEWTQMLKPKIADMRLEKGQSNLRRFSGQNRLMKAARVAVAQRLSAKEIGDLKHMFSLLDVNGDSTVTLYELKNGLDRLGKPETMESIREMIEAVDMDGSGRIDYTEFLAASMSQKRFLQETTCWAAFSVFDRDGSGKISKKELADVLASTEVKDAMGYDAVARALKECDNDGDGEIDFREFMRCMHEGGDDESLEEL